jgi:hypothetical protein
MHISKLRRPRKALHQSYGPIDTDQLFGQDDACRITFANVIRINAARRTSADIKKGGTQQ